MDEYGTNEHEDPDRAIKRRRMIAAYVRPKMIGASARPIRFYRVVNCAGPWAGKISDMAGIGKFWKSLD
jgi:glycerol-3-phosphate dehydrogenase